MFFGDRRQGAAGIGAFRIDRIGALRRHRGPAQIVFVEGDMGLAHQLVLLPAHVATAPAPGNRHQQAERPDDDQPEPDVGFFGPLLQEFAIGIGSVRHGSMSAHPAARGGGEAHKLLGN